MRAIVLPAVLLMGTALAGTAASQDAPSPVPTTMPEGNATSPVPTGSAPTKEFPDNTEDVRKALATVGYKDCGTGGPGKLLITFQNDGTVDRVVLAEGTWDPNVAVCVTRRFMEVTIPPFEGESRTVKWSVVLAGGAPKPATYAAPPGYGPPPGYGLYPRERLHEELPADDGPPPAGYHREERGRTGSLVSGSIITAMGLFFFVIASDQTGDKSDLQLISLAHFAVGIPLFCVGLTKRKVFVLDNASVSLAPTVTKSSATFGLSVTF